MKKIFKIIIITVVVGILYYILSLVLMNNNPYVLHYYGYDNYEEARDNEAIINPNVNYTLIGFTPEQEEDIRTKSVFYTTKSNYQELYGFLISLDHEDERLQRVVMELKNEDEFSDLFSGYTNVLYKGEVIGSIDGFSLNEFRDKEIITLEVTEYINKEEVKIGEIIIDLREN